MASADLGQRDFNSWSWVDTKGTTGPTVVSRYATRPVRTATGTGGMSQLTLPTDLWDWTTKAPRIPLETWTVTATSATSFTVVGSVSGTHPNATLGSGYTSTNGVSFLISAGNIPFVAGDKFVFSVVDHYDLDTTPGVVSYTIPQNHMLVLKNSDVNMYMNSEGRGGSALIVYEAGYIALTDGNPPEIHEDYSYPVTSNVALPARSLTHDNAVTILPFWDELQQKATSKIRTLLTGPSGSRTFVVEYKDFAHKDDPTASYTFQVVFFENQDRVRFHYVKLTNGTGSSPDGSTPGTSANGSTATIGLQGRLNSSYAASAYSANAASVMDGVAIEFGYDGDGDRLPNGIEQQYGTSDGNRFTDGGSTLLFDSGQIIAGLNPTDNSDNASKGTDTDSDTILDVNEVIYGTNPAMADSDGDGLSDGIEINSSGTDPLVADTDGDGLSDGMEDTDKDGSTNGGTETSPTEWDTDGDGVGDGTEVAQQTNALTDTSGRFLAEMQLGGSTVYGLSTAVDSKGNLHVVWATNSQNNTPDDLWVALFKKNGNTYEVAVARTLIDTHTGMDDRTPTIVTVPGTSTVVDKTIIMNNSRRGFAFLTTIDFSLSPMDGNATTAATIVSNTRMLDFPVAVNHPQMKLANNKLHLVFQGQEVIDTQYFENQHVPRGTYYVQMELDGTVTVGPIEMFRKEVPSHHHTFPRVAIDSAGNVHSIVRGGYCNWNAGPMSCSLYYTKLSPTGAVIIPTTRFQLEGQGGFHKWPELLVSPNGIVNVIYVTTAPMLGTSSSGSGWSVGNEVRLHSFATLNNEIQTVTDQKVLLSFAPDATMGLPSNHRINTFRTPSATLDAGGNIHLFVVEDQNLSSTGMYYAFDPAGNKKLGPYHLDNNIEGQTGNAIDVVGDNVLFTYKSGDPNVRQLDITGHGLDLSGGAQVPLPELEALAITSITPPNVASGGMAIVTIAGTGFVNGTTFTIGGVTVNGVTSFAAGNRTGSFDAAGLADGPYDVVATNPNGDTVTLEDAFYVGDLPLPPATDDGCCDLSGSQRSPIGSLLLVALVAFGLRRRRSRAAAATIAGVIACVYVALSPATASAGLGVRDYQNWAWSDSKSGLPSVISRFTTVPVRSAGSTGNGTMNQPYLPAKLYNWTNNTVIFPIETWTLTATSSTTFTVVGSVSGAQTNATVGSAYTSASGLNFTITAGGTAFVAGDQFTFSVVDKLDPSTLPGAVSSTMPGNQKLISAPFSLRTEGRNSSGIVAYKAGYLAMTDSNPQFLDDFGPQQLPNTALPARILQHDRPVPVIPFWDELKTKSTSKIWTAIWGRSGSRVFIVEYNDFAHESDPTASYTFQVLFFENLDRFRYQYIKLQNGSGTSANGSTATIGSQGNLMNRYTAIPYSVNTGSLVEGLVIEFGTDNDGDRIPEGVEAQYGTNPNSRNSDGGSPSISDSAQFLGGIDPTNPADNSTRGTDTDGDTILDAEEAIYGTNASMMDSDADGLNDNIEINSNGTDPLVADTDGDGLSDGAEDADKNGSVDVTETSPTNWDTDNDGVSDATEIAQGTDKLLDTSSRFVAELVLGVGDVRGISSALDSKGNLHVAWTERQDNGQPDDLFVALLSPKDGTYQLAVAPTLMNMHTGMDDRTPTIAIAPGAAGSTVDRTVMINNSRDGYAFPTHLAPWLAARDGTATMPATIITANRMFDFPLGVNHPQIKVAGNKVHLVFQGQMVLGAEFNNYAVDRGAYYVQLDADGTIVVPPIELFRKNIPSHHHAFPRLAVDASGNVHTILRGGDCRWETGPVGCSFYYTKISSSGSILIPTTALQLRGNGGIHKSPELLVSPNGLVNVIYTTISPLMGAAGGGGYSVGNEVQLYSFATTNNRITTVIDQKTLLSVVPEAYQGLPSDVYLPTYRAPAATLDAGGNIHLFVQEDNNLSDGVYAVFDPSGTRKYGPYLLDNAGYGYGPPDTIQVTSNDKVLFAYKHNNNNARFRELDITGSGLDLTGAGQVPLPEPEALSVTGVWPAKGPHRASINVTISGTGFVAGTTIKIGGVALTNVNTYDNANVLGDFSSLTLVDGVYDIEVTNPDGTVAMLPAAFTVGDPSTGDDGGCCETGGGAKRPLTSLVLALGVVLALRRRRRS